MDAGFANARLMPGNAAVSARAPAIGPAARASHSRRVSVVSSCIVRLLRLPRVLKSGELDRTSPRCYPGNLLWFGGHVDVLRRWPAAVATRVLLLVVELRLG